MNKLSFRDKVTYLSFLFSIGIVYIHSQNYLTYGLIPENGGFENFVYCFESTMGRFCGVFTNAFFMLSGYLLFRNFSFSRDEIKRKYRSRFFSLVIPYLIWVTFYYLLFAALTRLPILSDHVNESLVELSVAKYLSVLWNCTYSLMWFVKYLIISILPFPLYYLLFRITKQKYTWILSPFSFIVFLLLSSELIPWRFTYLQLPFLVGVYAGINLRSTIENPPKWLSVCAAIFLLALLPVYYYLSKIHVVIYTISCITIFFSFDYLPIKKEPKQWMHWSFFIFCIHELILAAVEKIGLIFFGYHTWIALLDYIIAPIISIAIIVFIGYFMQKKMPFFWKIITGRRN